MAAICVIFNLALVIDRAEPPITANGTLMRSGAVGYLKSLTELLSFRYTKELLSFLLLLLSCGGGLRLIFLFLLIRIVFLDQANIIKLVKGVVEQRLCIELVKWLLIEEVHFPLRALTNTKVILFAKLMDGLLVRLASHHVGLLLVIFIT